MIICLLFAVVYSNATGSGFQWPADNTETTMPDIDSELGILILAGGQSQRMGMDKALLPFKGRTFIECLVDQCVQASSQVVVSVAGEEQLRLLESLNSFDGLGKTTFVEDQHEAKGPLAGMEAGLRALEPNCRYALVLGCDVPVLKAGLAHELLRIAKEYDCRAVTPIRGDRVFGMTAVYRTDSWHVARELIDQNSLRVSDLAKRLNARTIELAELRKFDPELISFLNINDPQAFSAFVTSQGDAVDAALIQRLNTSAKRR